MSIFSTIDIAGSGLSAQRLKMDLIAANIANINTTRTPEGGPFKRQLALFATRSLDTERKFPFLPREPNELPKGVGEGVKVIRIEKDPSPPRLVYDPSHPDANEEGYVAMPNVNIVNEMVDMIAATRAYEANTVVISSAKRMAQSALDI